MFPLLLRRLASAASLPSPCAVSILLATPQPGWAQGFSVNITVLTLQLWESCMGTKQRVQQGAPRGVYVFILHHVSLSY